MQVVDSKSQRKHSSVRMLRKNSKLVCIPTNRHVHREETTYHVQMSAAKSGNHTKVEKLLEGGADVNTKEFDYVSCKKL